MDDAATLDLRSTLAQNIHAAERSENRTRPGQVQASSLLGYCTASFRKAASGQTYNALFDVIFPLFINSSISSVAMDSRLKVWLPAPKAPPLSQTDSNTLNSAG